MANIKFACPHCSQHITCDELWGGHHLECPNCKNTLAVPAVAAPSAPSLVPKPPPAVEPLAESIRAYDQAVEGLAGFVERAKRWIKGERPSDNTPDPVKK